jgi:hypothetical protein
MKKSMLRPFRLRALVALTLWGIPGCSQAPDWNGTYSPISSVCANSPLVISGGSFTYMDCTKLKLTVVRSSASELVFLAGPGKCSLSNWTLALTRSGADVNVGTYKTAGDHKEGRPSFECTYEVKPEKNAPKRK